MFKDSQRFFLQRKGGLIMSAFFAVQSSIGCIAWRQWLKCRLSCRVELHEVRGLRLESEDRKQCQSADVGKVIVCFMQAAGSRSCFYITVTVRHCGTVQEVVSWFNRPTSWGMGDLVSLCQKTALGTDGWLGGSGLWQFFHSLTTAWCNEFHLYNWHPITHLAVRERLVEQVELPPSETENGNV